MSFPSIHVRAHSALRRACWLVGVLALGACASGPPTDTTYSLQPAPSAVPGPQDRVSVVFSHYPNVILTESDKIRIQEKIQKGIDSKKRGIGADAPRHFRVNVVFTNYDRGDMFDRMRGQSSGNMHLSATVTVLLLPGNQRVSEFVVKEEYGGSGLEGYTTNIQHLEDGFLAGIIAGVVAPK